jgi:hypothetical protein
LQSGQMYVMNGCTVHTNTVRLQCFILCRIVFCYYIDQFQKFLVSSVGHRFPPSRYFYNMSLIFSFLFLKLPGTITSVHSLNNSALPTPPENCLKLQIP